MEANMSDRYLAMLSVIRKLGSDEGVDNELPGMSPPVDPGYGLPDWSTGHPSHPIPPVPPGGAATLPIYPGGPSLPIYVPVPPVVDNTLPPPPTIYPPLPTGPDNSLPPVYPDGEIYILVIIPGIGWRYMLVDMENEVTNPMPGHPTPK
jgi:hypothetical protein